MFIKTATDPERDLDRDLVCPAGDTAKPQAEPARQ